MSVILAAVVLGTVLLALSVDVVVVLDWLNAELWERAMSRERSARRSRRR